MITIPQGLTVNIGRREYREGDTLPETAPEAVKKLVNDRIKELAKEKKEPGKPLDTIVTVAPPQGDSGK
jgi:hypothetical protein